MSLDLKIVISTFNGKKNIATCLEAIGNNLRKEIYLIHSNSTWDPAYLPKMLNLE